MRHPAPEGLSQGSIDTDSSGGVIASNGGMTRATNVRLRVTMPSGVEHDRCYRLVPTQSQDGETAGRTIIELIAVNDVEGGHHCNGRSLEVHEADCY